METILAEERAAKTRANRAARHRLLDKLREVTTLPQVVKCMKVPRTAGGVGIRVGGDGRAGYAGLSTCGSVWACPVHAAKIGAERAREELAPVIRWVIDERGGSVLHTSLTVQHRAGLPLAKTRAAVQGGWEFLGSHKTWRRIDTEFGMLGWTRAFEATHKKRNGWHPHLHVLMYFDHVLSPEDALKISRDVFEVYQRGLEKSGFTCSAEHGVHTALATTRRDADIVLGEYLTKIASELTRNDTKIAKGGGYTPFDLLREAVEQGNADALDLWHEWEKATFNTRQLTWSGRRKDRPNIRELAGIGKKVKTDQEIAEEELGDPTVITITAEGWRIVWRDRTKLLDIVETQGIGSATDWLTRRGVAWQLPVAGVDEPGWRPDIAATREILRRSAHTVGRSTDPAPLPALDDDSRDTWWVHTPGLDGYRRPPVTIACRAGELVTTT